MARFKTDLAATDVNGLKGLDLSGIVDVARSDTLFQFGATALLGGSEGERATDLFGVFFLPRDDLRVEKVFSYSLVTEEAGFIASSGDGVISTAPQSLTFSNFSIETDVFVDTLASEGHLGLTRLIARGDDRFIGSDGGDNLASLGGDDLVRARGGDDSVRAGSGDDTVLGGAGDDLIRAGGGADRVSAGAGDDVARGGRGDDRLAGGADNDVLIGGAGRDRLIGGGGEDTLQGGLGADTFILKRGGDVVRDFTTGDDLINLRRVREITDFDDLLENHLMADGGDLRIMAGGDVIAVISDLTLDLLTADDFLF